MAPPTNNNNSNGYSYQTNEVNPHDLHIKMSKKIAQLTKVIYALNTKADEHESIVEDIEQKHEESMNKFISDSQSKLLSFKSKLEDQAKLSDKIKSLQSKCEELDRLKLEKNKDIDDLKHAVDEHVTKLKIEHSTSILSLSKQLENMKIDFQKQAESFDKTVKRLVEDKDKTLKETRLLHNQQVDTLKDEFNKKLNESEQWKNAELEIEIGSLKERLESLNLEKENAESRHLDDLQASSRAHAKEIEELISASKQESAAGFEQQLAKLREESSLRENEMNIQILQLQSDLKCSNDELDRARDLLKERDLMLNEKVGEREDLSDQYSQLRHQLEDNERHMTQLQSTLQQQEETITESNKRITQLQGEADGLEKSVVTAEMQCRERELELNVMHEKSTWLEKENAQLVLTNEKILQQINDDSTNWQKVTAALKKELSDLTESNKLQVQKLQSQHQEELERLKAEHERLLQEAKDKHESEINKYMSTNTQLQDHKLEFEKRLRTEQNNFERERIMLQEQLEKLQTDWQKKHDDLEKRHKSTLESLDSSSAELCANVIEVKELKKKIEIYIKEKDDKNIQLQNKQLEIIASEKEWNKKKSELEQKLLLQAQEAAQASVVAEAELNAEWQKKLNNELNSLSSSLTNESSKHVQDQLKRMEEEKQRQLTEQRVKYESQLKELHGKLSEAISSADNSRKAANKEVSDLKDALNVLRTESEEKLKSTITQYENDLQNLRDILQRELLQETNSSSQKLEAMEERFLAEHTSELLRLREQLEKEAQNQANMLETQHAEQIDRLTNEYEAKIEQYKNDNTAKHMSEIQKLTEGFNHQVAHLKKEIEKVNTMKNRLDAENQAKLNGLKEELSHRNSVISEVEREMSHSKETVLRLNNELDFKEQVVQKIRVESEQNLRKRQADIDAMYKSQMDALEAEHIRASQKSMQEFTKASENLKHDIRDLKSRLRAAVERYENRESRPEDIDKINRLQHMIDSEEEKIKKLVAEKEYFQRELVNRETNFNKVFNTNPNVGVLNPLSVGKQNKPQSHHQQSSSSSSFTATRDRGGAGLIPGTPPMKLTTPPGGRLEPLQSSTNGNNAPGPRYTPTPPRVPKRFL